MPKKLDDNAVTAFLEKAKDWSREDDFLVRSFRAPSARAALRLIQRIGDLSEGANHHPDLYWVYDRLRIKLTTHDAGGLTQQDLNLARCIEDVLAEG